MRSQGTHRVLCRLIGSPARHAPSSHTKLMLNSSKISSSGDTLHLNAVATCEVSFGFLCSASLSLTVEPVENRPRDKCLKSQQVKIKVWLLGQHPSPYGVAHLAPNFLSYLYKTALGQGIKFASRANPAAQLQSFFKPFFCCHSCLFFFLLMMVCTSKYHARKSH